MRMKPSGALRGLLSEYLEPDPTDPRYRMSPDPRTGGRVPLPSFDEDGNYVPPPETNFNPRKPNNTLRPEKPLDPKLLAELLRKLGGTRTPPKMTLPLK